MKAAGWSREEGYQTVLKPGSEDTGVCFRRERRSWNLNWICGRLCLWRVRRDVPLELELGAGDIEVSRKTRFLSGIDDDLMWGLDFWEIFEVYGLLVRWIWSFVRFIENWVSEEDFAICFFKKFLYNRQFW